MRFSSCLTGAKSALAFFTGGDLAAVACTLVGVMRFSSCLTGAKSALAFFSGGDFTAVSFPLVGVGVLGLGSAFTVDDGCAVKVDNASLLAFSLGSFSDWEVVVGKTSGALLAVSPPLAALDSSRMSCTVCARSSSRSCAEYWAKNRNQERGKTGTRKAHLNPGLTGKPFEPGTSKQVGGHRCISTYGCHKIPQMTSMYRDIPRDPGMIRHVKLEP